MQFSLPKWYDLHVHLRQEEFLEPLIQAQLSMGCCGVLAMPNTKPPLAKVLENDPLPYDSIENYINQLNAAGANQFDDFIVPLYLTKDTTAKMIEDGAKSGYLRAAKYYPPHGTTGAELGYPFSKFIENGVFEAMQDAGVVLCMHGEEHGLESEDYFDKNKNAEEHFYREQMPRIAEKLPQLKMVGEHLTTKVAVETINQLDNAAGSITPQHLLYTVGHLLNGCKYHLYCLPLLKFEEDRQALRKAATDANNTKFFAGTDSAPHTKKATECGCAAGCFTGGIAPQLYADAFEQSGVDLSSNNGQQCFIKFMSLNGPDFYDLKVSEEMFTLSKEPQKISKLTITEGNQVTPLPIGMGTDTLNWSIKL